MRSIGRPHGRQQGRSGALGVRERARAARSVNREHEEASEQEPAWTGLSPTRDQALKSAGAFFLRTEARTGIRARSNSMRTTRAPS